MRAVIEPAVVVDEKSRWELEARADGESQSPLAHSRFPHRQRNLQQRLNGRAQSDPQPCAIALDVSARRAVLVELDTGGSAADHHGARADVSHQRLRHFAHAVGRRPPGGAREVRRHTICRHDRAVSDHQLHRHTDDAGARRGPARHPAARFIQRRLRPAGRRGDATRAAAYVVRAAQPRADGDRLRHDGESRSHRVARRRMADSSGQRRSRLPRHRDPDSGRREAAGAHRRRRRRLPARTDERRVPLPGRGGRRCRRPRTGFVPRETSATWTTTVSSTSSTAAPT